MALTTWTELKASIADWLHRTDLTTVIPDFITLAEERIAYDLAEVPALWNTSSSVAITSGSSAVTMPVDCMGLISARIISPTSYVDSLSVMTYAELVRKTGLDSEVTGPPQALAMRGNDGGTAGQAKGIVYPVPEQNYTLEVTYRAALLALGSGQATNFVLKRAPSLYLFGSLIESAPYLHNDARLMTWQGRYEQALSKFLNQSWDGPILLGTDLPVAVRSNILTG